MIALREVSHEYGPLRVLDGVSFSAGEGEFVALVGPSGCGKTTLLKIIGGLLRPSAGDVAVDSRTPEQARSTGEFGFVFQRPVLLPWRNVIDNVRLPLEILNGGRRNRQVRDPADVLDRLGLTGFASSKPTALSGGMQQRVALARALVFGPRVLLMDEPFAALDEILRERMDLEFRRLAEELRQTVVLVTHNISEAALLADKIVVLSARPGRVLGHVDLTACRPVRCGSEEHFAATRRIRQLMEGAL
jgi:NitT/TauT family transport system ATP-binding protein